jgi:hypothetical protein
VFLERPRVDLKIPVLVPKTRPQAVVLLGSGSRCPALAGRRVCRMARHDVNRDDGGG